MRIEKDVLEVLDRAEPVGNALTLVGQLDRALYLKTNKVLEAAGGTWNRKSKAHIFDGDAAARIDEIILTGSVIIPRDEFEFLASPPPVAQRVICKADVKAGMLVLEPSAGHAALIEPLKDIAVIDCIEKMPANAEFLRKLEWVNSLVEADFLSVMPSQKYDRIIMNPPFSRQADIKHVLHALQFLKPDGLLVSVMAAGVVFRSNKLAVEFRDLIEERGGEIEELPDGSFKASGTAVNTVIVTIPGAA